MIQPQKEERNTSHPPLCIVNAKIEFKKGRRKSVYQKHDHKRKRKWRGNPTGASPTDSASHMCAWLGEERHMPKGLKKGE